MTKAVLVVLSMLLVLTTPAFFYPVEGQNHAVDTTWSRTYWPGEIYSLDVTPEGGLAVAGRATGGLVMKINPAGQLEWSRSYLPTGYGDADVTSIRTTFDRGYLLSGAALSFNYTLAWDAWLLKLDHRGQVQWSKTYGGPEGEAFTSVEQTRDEGYIVAGNTASVSEHYSNGWVLKLGSHGDVVWQEAFVGSDVLSVDETFDGGFVAAGTVDVDGLAEPWVLKLDSAGRVVWQKAYGFSTNRSAYPQARFVRQRSDGGYVVVGEQTNFTPSGVWVSSNILVFALDREGIVQWQKSFTGGGFTEPFSTEEVSDGGIIIAGRFTSRRSPPYEGLKGPFLLKLDSNGSIVWQKVYGESNDFFHQARETKSGGLAVAGFLFSNVSRRTELPSNAWVLKLDAEGGLQGCALGFPSNATITDTYATALNTTETPLGTDARVTPGAITVRTLQGTPQRLCPSHVTRKHSNTSSPGPAMAGRCQPAFWRVSMARPSRDGGEGSRTSLAPTVRELKNNPPSKEGDFGLFLSARRRWFGSHYPSVTLMVSSS